MMPLLHVAAAVAHLIVLLLSAVAAADVVGACRMPKCGCIVVALFIENGYHRITPTATIRIKQKQHNQEQQEEQQQKQQDQTISNANTNNRSNSDSIN